MTMEISRLGIEVTSTGIREASAALGGLSTSANNADRRVASLTANLTNLMRASNSTIGSTSGLSGTMALINIAMQSAATQAAALAQALGSTAQGMNNMATAANNSSRALQQHSYHGGVVVTTLKAMTTAALAYFSVRSARNVVEQSDAWGMMQAKLKLATGSMEAAKDVQRDLFDMAQRMRAPLEDMGKLYTRLAPALQRMGKTSEDTKNMVESVALALKLGGATAGEAASTMLQFSQSANAGRLNGAEFNSVAENGVLILRALEEHLGKNQAELKKMGADGKLTFDIISAALEAQRPKWQKEFDELPLTFESAMQRLKNAWFKAIGEVGQDDGLGKKLAESVLQLEQDIPRVAEVLVKSLTFVLDNIKPLTVLFTGLIGLGVVKWGMEAVAAFTTVASAVTNAGGAAVVARAALGFLTGPIGIATTLLTAGVTAWMLWGKSGEDASTKVTDKTKVDVDKRIAELEREIKKLEERNQKAADGLSVTGGQKLEPAAQQLLDTITDINTKLQDPKTTEVQRTSLLYALGINQAKFETLMNDKARLGVLAKQAQEEERLKKLTELNKANKKRYGTPQEQAKAELEDMAEKYKALGESVPDWLKKAIEEKKTHAGKKAENQAEKERRQAEEAAKNVEKLSDETEFLIGKMIEQHAASEKLSASERERFNIEKLLRDTQDPQARALLNAKLATLDLIRARELYKEGLSNQYKLEEEGKNKQYEQIAVAEKELATLNDKIAEYGKLKGAVEDYGLAAAKTKLESMTQFDDGSDKNGEIKRQRDLIAVLEQVAAAKQKLDSLSLGDKITQEMDALKPADWGNAFGDAFGKVGKSVDKAGKALDQYNKKMEHLSKIRENIMKDGGEKKHSDDLEKLRNEELKNTLDMYGDMAGAVKGFFKEKTLAYKVFDAFEKGIRIAQMALTIQEMLVKLGANEAVMVSDTERFTHSMTHQAIETESAVGNALVQAGAWLQAGVAHAFAALGPWGFPVAAAMIALLASLGFHGGGGGGGSSIPLSEQRQKKQGTGTVLGDDEAKSASIKNSLERLRDNSNIGLTHSAGMLVALRNIEANIGGLTASIARVNGLTTGKNFGIQTGTNSSGGVLGISGLFGKSVSRNITDTGLTLSGTLAALGIQQYLDVQETTKKSGFFGIGGSTKTKNFRQYQDVDKDVKDSIGAIFSSIGDTIVNAASQLGGDSKVMKEELQKFVINTEVSFKDLAGQELEDALNAVFSATADDMAKTVFPTVLAFQRAGEGYFDTLTRVAFGTERAENALKGLGVSMVDLKTLSQKQADVDVELVRQSLIKQETGTSLVDILQALNGSMEDLVDAYKELTRLRTSMQATGLGSNLSMALIRGAGGLSELGSAMDDYFDGFFTDEQKSQIAMSKLRMEFARLNVALPASKDGFKSLVASLMNGDEASQELAGRILSLSGDFAEAMDALDSGKQDKINNAKDALKDAYDKEADAISNLHDKMKDFASSLKDFRDSLIMGDMSTKSVMEKYQTALLKYNDVSAKALTGDQDAISQFQKVAQDLLSFSRQVNASGTGYTSDYERVLTETEALRQYTEGQADQATQSLDLLKQQVDGLIEINDSVKTVAQAIEDLHAAMAITTGTAVTVDGSHASGLANVPFDGYIAELHAGERVLTAGENKQYALAGSNANAAMCDEIKALREEVRQLREEQRQQTVAVIDANYDANERNAQAVVEGSKDAAKDVAYANRNIGLN